MYSSAGPPYVVHADPISCRRGHIHAYRTMSTRTAISTALKKT
jgi:hypothetical protein